MRQISINSICTLSVAAAIVAVITVLVIYVSTSSYHMVAGVQTEALDETSKIVALGISARELRKRGQSRVSWCGVRAGRAGSARNLL